MSVLQLLFGKPLASDQDRTEKLGVAEGVPVFGLDALGSSAYGPEAALTLLIPLGAASLSYIVPISLSVIALLLILYFSYRQTIEAYPSGGGSYTVASENLGRSAGLFSAAALIVDYVLVVAVGIAAGTGALISAFPRLQPLTLEICLIILLLIGIVNLRGLRESGAIFTVPTYLFTICMLSAIAFGAAKSLLTNGHPAPAVSHRPLPSSQTAAGLWLLLRAFSSGCTAMTGVEAVSNGVTSFREPRTRNAQRTLTIIITILVLLLGGIGYLCRAYAIGATEAGRPGYENVLSQLVAAIAGRNWFYYLTLGSVVLVLTLQANTAFAGFPLLCRIIAHDNYLPRSFANRGRRLVYTHGIVVLLLLSGTLLIMFGGVTDRLIPLFAIGAFLAFTFSQAGMVAHWKRVGGKHSIQHMLLNALGATATAATVVVVIVSKFSEGAWITLLLIPALLIMMTAVHRYYKRFEREISCPKPLDTSNLHPPLAVIPIENWNKMTEKALRFALTISPEIVGVHIDTGEGEDRVVEAWRTHVQNPARAAGFTEPRLTVLKSPFRLVITPILDFVLDLEQQNEGREIAVLIPELIQRRWYQYLMHNQTGKLLSALLLMKGDRRISIINVPWYRMR